MTSDQREVVNRFCEWLAEDGIGAAPMGKIYYSTIREVCLKNPKSCFVRRRANSKHPGQSRFEGVFEIEHGLAPELALHRRGQRVAVAELVIQAHAGAEIVVLAHLVVVIPVDVGETLVHCEFLSRCQPVADPADGKRAHLKIFVDEVAKLEVELVVVDAGAQGVFGEDVTVADAIIPVGKLELMGDGRRQFELPYILSDRGIREKSVVVTRKRVGDRRRDEVVADMRVISRTNGPVRPGTVIIAVVEKLRFRMLWIKCRNVGTLRWCCGR